MSRRPDPHLIGSKFGCLVVQSHRTVGTTSLVATRCLVCGWIKERQLSNVRKFVGTHCPECPPDVRPSIRNKDVELSIEAYAIVFGDYQRIFHQTDPKKILEKLTPEELVALPNATVFAGTHTKMILSALGQGPQNHGPLSSPYNVIRRGHWDSIFSNPEPMITGTIDSGVWDKVRDQLIKDGNQNLVDFFENDDLPDMKRVMWTSSPHNDQDKMYIYPHHVDKNGNPC